MTRIVDRLGPLAIVGLAGLLLGGLIAMRPLAQADWDVTLFGSFGEEAMPTRLYAEERLGEVYLRANQGHDGKFFFVQANDPWVLDPQNNAEVLDRPLYRSQRMLYPVLAGGAGMFGPDVIVWAMLIVNLIAMGLGSWAVALIAQHMGGSRWWGLAFVLNVGFISEMSIGGAGAVSATFAFWGVAMFLEDRPGWGIALLALAALSREAMLIAAFGVAWWLWRKRGKARLAILVATIPLAGVAAWAVYLRMRLGFESPASEVQEIGLPFAGLLNAMSSWLEAPLGLVIGIGMVTLMVVYLWRTVTSDRLVGWAFLGFAALAMLLTEQVWVSYFDITRAIAPMLTAFLLLAFIKRGRRRNPSTALH